MFNKLLQRQITKTAGGIESLPEEVLNLLRVVSESYDHYEKDRKMLERSIELTSKEMIELNNTLRREADEGNKVVLEKLKESLELLQDDETIKIATDSDYITLSHLADLLRDETKNRQKAEKENEQKTKYLLASQRIAQIGSWELNLQSRDINENTLFWSEETYRIFGYEPYSVEVTNELFFSRIHPADVVLIQDVMKKSLDTLSVYDIEHRIILPNNKEKIVHERAELIIDERTGRPIKLLGTVQDITERMTAKHNLQKVNEELRLLFDNMNEVYFSIDIKTDKLLQMSTACERVYGYSLEDFEQNNNLWFNVILEEDKSIINSNYPAMNAGKSLTQQYRILRKDGTKRWLETKIKPTLDREGSLIRIDGITSDITDSKESEITLRNSEERFKALIENSADAIMVLNIYGEPFYASDSLYRIMGYKPEDILGVNTLRYIHSEDLSLLDAHFKRVLENPGKTFSIIYRRLKKDGTYIWCEGSATNLLHAPLINGIVVNFRDITQRKQSEQALIDSESKFRSLIENSSDAITVIDKENNIIFASDSLYRITGYSQDEYINKIGLDFIHPDDLGSSIKYLEDLKQNYGAVKQMIHRIRKKDGTYIWFERVATNLLHDSAVRGIVSNFRDVTERIEYEQTLKYTNEELQKSNKELDKFVYSVSHDLRAPLSSMMGVIEFTETETEDAGILKHLQMLKRSIEKLDGFILDILNYSRNARLQIDVEQINFEQLLEDVIENLKFMNTGYSNVSISSEIIQTTDFHSDGNRLSIVLNNLISNAIRYHNPHEKNPLINVTIDCQESEVIINVIDNGIGIPLEKHDKVFEMFYRISKKSGSGLGLYIVKETIEKLKGRITLDSTLGKGTTFTVIIPNLK